MDDKLYLACGRISDFSDSNFIGRDHGWIPENDMDEARIKKGIKKCGLAVREIEVPEDINS